MAERPEKPIIGLATQTLQPIPGQVPLAWVMGQQYVRALTAVGALPWIVPLLADDLETLRQIYDRLDAVFLAGGLDIEPNAYGELRIEQCGFSDADRDAVEQQLIHWAKADGKPLLGVCRGVQMINVAFGGTLYQDLATQRPEFLKHDYFPQQGFSNRSMIAHQVMVEPNTKLHALVGNEIAVNSLHHQGIKELGTGLIASAHSPDGMIEGIEGSNGHFLIGVQWHPEELSTSDPAMRRVFEAFVAAARDFRSSRSDEKP